MHSNLTKPRPKILHPAHITQLVYDNPVVSTSKQRTERPSRSKPLNSKAYRRLFAAVQIVRVATKCTATVQLDVEFVVITTGPVDVDAEWIVSKP